jgi:hypothetical protein
MAFEIVDFGAEHCEQAAALVAARFQTLQAQSVSAAGLAGLV